MATSQQLKVHASSVATEKTRKRGNTMLRQRQLWGWLFLSPWIIGFFAFTIIPMGASLIFSFTDFFLLRPEEISYVGLRNYRRLFTDPLVKQSLNATVRFAAIALPLSIGLPVALAALLNSELLIGKRFFRTLFYMPYMVPIVSGVYIWGGMLNTNSGWINRFLREFLNINGPNWIFDTSWIYPALNIIGLWGIGNAMLITLATMQGVPTQLYEAARVDGASALNRFRHITLPMISPVIFYNLVLSVIGLFRYFEIPFILKEGSGDPGGSTMFFNIHLYKTAFTFQDMGYGSTLAWLLFFMAGACTIFLFLTSKFWVFYAGGQD